MFTFMPHIRLNVHEEQQINIWNNLCWAIHRVSKTVKIVFVRTSSNFHQLW